MLKLPLLDSVEEERKKKVQAKYLNVTHYWQKRQKLADSVD